MTFETRSNQHITSQKSSMLTSKQQDKLLKQLTNMEGRLEPKTIRMHRKLKLRKYWRERGLAPFNLDAQIKLYVSSNENLESLDLSSQNYMSREMRDQIESIRFTPYSSSFASRILGRPSQSSTLSKITKSSFDGKILPKYIRRDFECAPLKALLLHQLSGKDANPAPIDYCYLQQEYLPQVNALLQRTFWPGINAKENLKYPNYSVVALYKRLVVGCALMTPDIYVSFIAVSAGWEGVGIGQNMLFHLISLQGNQDLTLHVSANNNAMILYQKFGFKPEEFIVNFYEKYLPDDSIQCKNALMVRRRR